MSRVPIIRMFGTLVIAAGVVVSSGTLVATSGAATSTATPKYGGVLTEMSALGETLPTLDPLSATQFQDAAIYGELFQYGPKGSILPDMASGYAWSNHNLTVNISLHQGIKFSDGTPFNASAVVYNIRRDLAPANSCQCLAPFANVKTVTAVGSDDVKIQLSAPQTNLIGLFTDEAPNYTVDPTALSAMGATAYGQHPIGAGPFEVSSFIPNSELVLKRNPRYFVSGEPYLSGVKILLTSSDQSDLESLESGVVGLANVTTPSVFLSAKNAKGVETFRLPATATGLIALDEHVAPFNNIIAREAVAYATDPAAIISSIYDGLYTRETGIEGPGQSFYVKNVTGYRAYDPNKAAQLVSEIPGGLTFTMTVGVAPSPLLALEAEAEAAEYNAVGMHVTLVGPLSSAVIVQNWINKVPFGAQPFSWDGEVDPGVDDSSIMSSTGLFSGVNDLTVNKLLQEGVSTSNPAARAKIYGRLYSRLNEQADLIPTYALTPLYMASSKVRGFASDVPVPFQFQGLASIWLA